MSQRRKDPRHAVELPATLFWALGEAVAETRNVSEKGAALSISGASVPSLNGLCEVSFRMPDAQHRLACRSWLRWSVAAGSRTLVGVEFVERLPAEVMQSLMTLAREAS